MPEGIIPVLFQIKFKGDKGLFELSEEFTAYPEEDEVLIQDGLEYKVVENKREYDDNQVEYRLVTLKYPPEDKVGVIGSAIKTIKSVRSSERYDEPAEVDSNGNNSALQALINESNENSVNQSIQY